MALLARRVRLCVRWFFILMTGYAKAHGLFPNPDTALADKEWGGRAQARLLTQPRRRWP